MAVLRMGDIDIRSDLHSGELRQRGRGFLLEHPPRQRCEHGIGRGLISELVAHEGAWTRSFDCGGQDAHLDLLARLRVSDERGPGDIQTGRWPAPLSSMTHCR